MTNVREFGIVRIRKKSQEIVGTGFLVDEQHVFTCAHVIEAALDVGDQGLDLPIEDVLLDFPFHAGSHTTIGQVVLWRPSIQGSQTGSDIAVLRIVGTYLPPTFHVYLDSTDSTGRRFKTYGFPHGYDDIGVNAYGVVRDRVSNRWRQIEDDKVTGISVRPGFSGAPVWDNENGGLIGMVVASAEAKVAFIIPSDVLIEAWPELSRYALQFSITPSHFLPPPFEWIRIPKGFVELSDVRYSSQYGPPQKKGMCDVGSFAISKYPITNAQYQIFIDALDGYEDSIWWEYCTQARKWHRENSAPMKPSFDAANIPRTNVNWYEAMAFCHWLSHKTNCEIALPTEQQWQRAAQGDTYWAYPWGDAFHGDTCNRNTDGVTPVTHYPKGASPYDVMDMIGNVWEWCLTEWETGSDSLEAGGDAMQRSLRGGAWKHQNIEYFRVDFRRSYSPVGRGSTVGFRVVSVDSK